MKDKWKKGWRTLLSMLLVFSFLPVIGFARGAPQPETEASVTATVTEEEKSEEDLLEEAIKQDSSQQRTQQQPENNALDEYAETIQTESMSNARMAAAAPTIPEATKMNTFLLKVNAEYKCFTDGYFNPEATGLFVKADEVQYYYAKEGLMKTDVTGIIQDEDKLVYVENGKYLRTFSGIAKEVDGEKTYFVRKGETTKDTGICQVPGGTDRYYVKEGIVQTDYSGILRMSGEKWCMMDGKVDENFTGFLPYNLNWWYLKDGKIDQTANGLIKGKAHYDSQQKGIDGTWYVVAGKVTYADRLVKDTDGSWWYVKDGKVATDFTGIKAKGNDLFAVVNGKVDTSYTGFLPNEWGWWYLENGKVNLSMNSIIKGAANTDGSLPGETAWWYVVGGKVQNTTRIARNSNGWWLVENGKVTFNYTGLYQQGTVRYAIINSKLDFTFNGFLSDANGWWYCEKSRVNTSKNDVVYGKAINGKSAYWVVRNGKIDTGYNGTIKYNGTTFNVKNGEMIVQTPIPSNAFRSYSDSTCTVYVLKKWYADSWCYCAHIQMTNYKRFGSASANGWYGNGTESTYHAGQRLGAILCVNGDYACQNVEPHAAIRRGTVEAYPNKKTYVPEAYNNNTGILFNAYEGYCFPGTNTKCSSYTIQESAQKGLITDTFIFGPSGLNNGTVKGSNGGSKRPRTLIGTNGMPGDIWLVVSAGDYSDGVSPGLTYYEGVTLLRDLGCTFGGHLDGGGSSAMYWRGEMLVANEGWEGRYVADFAYVK